MLVDLRPRSNTHIATSEPFAVGWSNPDTTLNVDLPSSYGDSVRRSECEHSKYARGSPIGYLVESDSLHVGEQGERDRFQTIGRMHFTKGPYL